MWAAIPFDTMSFSPTTTPPIQFLSSRRSTTSLGDRCSSNSQRCIVSYANWSPGERLFTRNTTRSGNMPEKTFSSVSEIGEQ